MDLLLVIKLAFINPKGAFDLSFEIKDFDATYARLLEASNAKNQSDLAKMLDMSKAGINHSIKRSRLPLEWILKLNYKFGVNPRYVLDGELPKHVSMRKIGESIEGPSHIDLDSLTYFQVPIVNSYVRQDGKFVRPERPEYVFLPSYKTKGIKGATDDLVGLTVQVGDMEPVICKNDTVVVDTNSNEMIPDGIFVFEASRFLFLRQVSFRKGQFYLQNGDGSEYDLLEEVEYPCRGQVIFFQRYIV